MPADYFLSHSQEHQHTAAWVVAAPSSAWGGGGREESVLLLLPAWLHKSPCLQEGISKAPTSDIPTQSFVDKLNDGKEDCELCLGKAQFGYLKSICSGGG